MINPDLYTDIFYAQQKLAHLINCELDEDLELINLDSWLFEFGGMGKTVLTYLAGGSRNWNFLTEGMRFSLKMSKPIVEESIPHIAKVRIPIMKSDRFILDEPINLPRDYRYDGIQVYGMNEILVVHLLPQLLNFENDRVSMDIYADFLSLANSQFMIK